MRQQKMECTHSAKINQFLSQARTGLLGLADGDFPYVIPLNYVWWDSKIYFHGASEGRKTEVLTANPNACFTVCEEYGTIANPVPAKTDTAYFSVLLFGKALPVTDLIEATAAMQQMLHKYVPGYYSQPLPSAHVEKYRSSLDSKTRVYAIAPDSITAKENPVDPMMSFYNGRTSRIDS
ncbi:pyridoxamine 5'-phosphate oxidase family protein [Bacillus sp. T33-2]|uniref:pyridoxamine 5'-phosphate oxidase family protein n=1 Tax=Bacillus sp. T33-2 TaxID=2054168 RepID=UPI000C78A323|nr:pyridoxamine 5'-phosphate oxidase family protein [Bacillus sp. T33-2]PLR97744.1 pyridoxamine 5'-phosphate oxidase family protein [Bacillus sp. T33-2]